MADTIIASLRANLRLDATGVEDTIKRFQDLDRNVSAARDAIAKGSTGFTKSEAVGAAQNFVAIGESAKRAAADTVSLIEKLNSIGASSEAVVAVSQKFAAALRAITAQSNLSREGPQPNVAVSNFKALIPSITAAKQEMNALIQMLDKYNAEASKAQSVAIKGVSNSSITNQTVEAEQLKTIQTEQMNLVRQAQREQLEADRQRQLLHSNNLLRLAKEAEATRAGIELEHQKALAKQQTELRSSGNLESAERIASAARRKFLEDEAQILRVNSEAKLRIAQDTSTASINVANQEAVARIDAAKRAAALEANVFKQKADAISQAAATQASAIRTEASAQLVAADAVKRAEEIKAAALVKTTQAKNAKKTLDAEVQIKELENAANAQKAALDAVASKQKDIAVTGASAEKNKQLADAVKKLATTTEELNKVQERLNAAKAREVAIESGVAGAIAKTNAELTAGLSALKAQEVERKRLQEANDKLRATLSQPVTQDGVLAWLRNLGSASTLVSGPLSGLTSRLQALASLTNREDFFTALRFGGVAAGIAGIMRFSNEAVRVAKNLEPVEQLLNLTRAANERTGKSFEDFTNIALKYGLSLEAIAKPFARLKIATEGTILAGDRFKELMSDMSAISATFALPQEQIAGMAKAVEQMLSKGTVQAEEFRQQLGDRLPAAARVGLLAYRQLTGNAEATMGDFLKAMEKRQINSAQFLDLFFTKFKQVYGIDSTKAIDNVAAAQGALSTAYDTAVFRIDKAIGATAAYKTALSALTTVLTLISNNASIASAAIGAASFVAGALVFQRLGASIIAANAAIASGGVALTGISLIMARVRTAATLLVGAFTLISGVFAIKGLSSFRTELSNTTTDIENAKKKLKDGVDSEGFTIFKIDPDSINNARTLTNEVNRFKVKAEEAMKQGVKLKPDLDLSSSLDKQIAIMRDKLSALSPIVEDKIGKGVSKSIESMSQALLGLTKGARGKKVLEEALGTATLIDGMERAKASLVSFQGDVSKTTTSTQHVTQEIGFMSQAFATAIPFIQGISAAYLTYITVIQGLKWTSVLTGFTAAGKLADTLSNKVGLLGKGFKLLGIAATATAVGLAVFRNEAEASTVGTDSLLKRVQALQDKFKTEEFIPKNAGQEALTDLQTKISDVTSTIQRLRQEYDAAVDVRKGKGDIISAAGSLKPPEKIQAEIDGLTATLGKLQSAYDQLSVSVDANDKLMGQQLGTMKEVNDTGKSSYAELVKSTDELRDKLEALKAGHIAEYEATRQAADEALRWSAAVESSGQSAASVNTIIAERINLMNQIRQFEAKQSVDKVYTGAIERAAAAKNGLLEQYDAQARLNSALDDFKVKAEAAGYTGSELAGMMETYKQSLQSIPEKTAHASNGIRKMADDIDYSIKKIKPVEILQKSLFSFADSFAELAVSGQLSAASLKDAFKKMALDISKDILALVIKINIILPLLKALQGAMGGGGGLGGLGEGLLGGSNGILSGIKFFAKGGIVDKPTMFGSAGGGAGVMGEAGTEAILPLARGPGGVLGVQSLGDNQSQTVNITFNVQATDANSFKQSEGQIAAMLTRATSRGNRNL